MAFVNELANSFHKLKKKSILYQSKQMIYMKTIKKDPENVHKSTPKRAKHLVRLRKDFSL